VCDGGFGGGWCGGGWLPHVLPRHWEVVPIEVFTVATRHGYHWRLRDLEESRQVKILWGWLTARTTHGAKRPRCVARRRVVGATCLHPPLDRMHIVARTVSVHRQCKPRHGRCVRACIEARLRARAIQKEQRGVREGDRGEVMQWAVESGTGHTRFSTRKKVATPHQAQDQKKTADGTTQARVCAQCGFLLRGDVATRTKRAAQCGRLTNHSGHVPRSFVRACVVAAL
jgi:hypothetical protein